MQVTQILPLDKKRSRVWLDEEFAFVLYKGELRRFRIEEDGEISESVYREIVEEVLPKRAKLRAMNLLKSHTYSEGQLMEKLLQGYYPKDIARLAVDYVASFGYIDDLRMSEEYIRIHLKDKSRMRIKQDLMRKQVDTETIEQAFLNCSDEGFVQDELAQIKKLLEKRGYDPKETNNINTVSKHFSFLMRKGYNPDSIRKVMGDFEM
jgi:regulatory protein